MTITEELQFSVLTAPVATLDRRSLSQAWYSALYGSSNGANAAKRTAAVARSAAAPVARHARAHAPSLREGPAAASANGGETPLRAQGTPQERRAPRSPLARKIERAFLQPRGAARKASFTVEGDHGRVHVLLRSQGSELKLVAICPPKARPHVAAALVQARYALAMRGINLSADARSEERC